tara:strand:- start:2708 stop:3835 length:1128 start_codon:yes stop_codon:yes gene_type:complete
MLMKVLVVFGTRPEAIKMFPLIKEIQKYKNINLKVCVTGQHREMLDQMLDIFDIEPNFDLNIMKKNQNLSDTTTKILDGMNAIFADWLPDWVVVHGDTTTTLSASLAAFYKKIKIAHVEAGLRTGDIYSPWPEEVNRKFTDIVSSLHFAPTKNSKSNLLKEGINEKSIIITGNTVIDALLQSIELIKDNQNLKVSIEKKFHFLDKNKKLLLVTCHRRENFDTGHKNVCQALIDLANEENVQIVYPVHPNPNISRETFKILDKKQNIYLIDPQEYLPFIYLMNSSYLMLTDSGGIQEEAPSLGKPVLVLRDKSERPEVVESGNAVVVGTDRNNIIKKTKELLSSETKYKLMSIKENPYGNGDAAIKIVEALLNYEN